MEFDERQIIKQCQKGNLEEFEKLYNLYFEKIYRFIYWRTSHRETAEDLTSQTFIKALEKISTFNQNLGTFSAWIFRIARNKTIDYYRRKKAELDIDRIWDLSSRENIAQDFQTKEKLKEAAQYLAQLKPKHREIIIMRVWDGLSYKEISQIVGKSEANCRMIFSRTIRKLRKEIALLLLFILII